MKYIGAFLIMFGIVDFAGSWVGFDLWGGFLGIQLPDIVWQFSAYAELAIGYVLWQMGSKSDKLEDQAGSHNPVDPD